MADGAGGSLGTARGSIAIDYSQLLQAAQAAERAFAAISQSAQRAGQGLRTYDAATGSSATASKSAAESARVFERELQAQAASEIRAASATRNYGAALTVIDRELTTASAGTRRYNDLIAQQARVQQAAQRAAVQSTAALRTSLSTTATALQSIALPLVAAGAAAGVMGAQFDESLRNINSIAKLSDDQLAALGQQFLTLSTDASKTREGATSLARGFYDIQSSGFAGADGMRVLEVATKAASAGMSDTATASRAITAVLNAYSLGADQAGRVSDVLFNTVDRGVTTFPELAAQVGDVVSSAAAAQIPIEELGAAIATLTKDGQTTNKAITNLNSFISSVIKPTEKASKAAKQYGIDLSLTNLNAKKLAGFIQEITDKTGGNAEAMAKLIGSQEGLRAVLSLSKNNLQAFRDDLASSEQTIGKTDAAFQEMGKSAKAQFALLRNELERAGITIGSAILPSAVAAAEAVRKLVQAFSALPQDEQQRYIDIALALGGTTVALYGFVKAVQGTEAVITAAKTTYGLMADVASKSGKSISSLSLATLASAAPFAAVAAALGLAIYGYTQYRNEINANIAAINQQSTVLQRAQAAQQAMQAQQPSGPTGSTSSWDSTELNRLLKARAGIVEQLAESQRVATNAWFEYDRATARADVGKLNGQLEAVDAQLAQVTTRVEGVTAAEQERANAAARANDATVAGLANVTATAGLTDDELKTLLATLDKISQAAQASLGTVIDTQAGFLETLAQQRSDYEDRVAELIQEKNAAKTKAERAGIDKRLAAEQEGYAKSTAQAAAAYAQQAALQQQAFGEQLIRLVQAQADLGNVSQEKADALIEVFRRRYGVVPSITETAFGAAKDSIATFSQVAGASAQDTAASIEAATAKATDFKQRFDELVQQRSAVVTAEFQEKGGDPKAYDATIRAIPGQVYTELSSNAPTATQSLDGYNAMLSRIPSSKTLTLTDNTGLTVVRLDTVAQTISGLPKGATIELRDNAGETTTRLAEARTALVTMPDGKQITLGSNAAFVQAALLAVNLALAAIPTQKTITVNANIAKPLQRRSPSPIEQTIMAIEEAARNPKTITVAAEGAQSLAQIVDALLKVKQAAAELGDGPIDTTPIINALPAFFETLSAGAAIASRAAKNYDTKTNEATSQFLDTAKSALDAVRAVIDVAKQAKDYQGIAPAALDWLGSDLLALVGKLIDVARQVNREGLPAAQEVGKALGDMTGGITSAIGVINATQDYQGVVPSALDWLGADLLLLIAKLIDVAGQVSRDGLPAAQEVGSALGGMVSGIADAITVITATQDYQGLVPSALDWLGADLLLVIQKLIEVAGQVSTEGAAAAAELGTQMQDIFGGVGAALEVLVKLRDYTGVAPAAVQAIATDVAGAIATLGIIAQQADTEGVKQAAAFGRAMSDVFGGLSAGLQFLDSLSKYEGVAPEAFDALASDVSRALALMQQMAAQAGDLAAAAAVFRAQMEQAARDIAAGQAAVAGLGGNGTIPSDVAGAAQNAGAQAANNVVAGAQAALAIRSPSQVARTEIGIPFVEGISAGIEAATPELLAVVQRLSENVTDDAREMAKQVSAAFDNLLNASGVIGSLGSGAASRLGGGGQLVQGQIDRAKQDLDRLSASTQDYDDQLKAVRDAINALLAVDATGNDRADTERLVQLEAQRVDLINRRAQAAAAYQAQQDRITQLEATKNDPFADDIAAIDAELAAGSQRDIFNNAALTQLEQDRLDLLNKQRQAKEAMALLDKQQQDLSFLQQQTKLLDLIAQYGLNPVDILGNVQLGLNTPLVDLIQALNRANAAIIQQVDAGIVARVPGTSGGTSAANTVKIIVDDTELTNFIRVEVNGLLQQQGFYSANRYRMGP